MLLNRFFLTNQVSRRNLRGGSGGDTGTEGISLVHRREGNVRDKSLVDRDIHHRGNSSLWASVQDVQEESSVPRRSWDSSGSSPGTKITMNN